jgi:hypothetical protein
MRFLFACVLAIAMTIVGSANTANAQFSFDDINIDCAFGAANAAFNHECRSSRRFVCLLEKAAAGGLYYRRCDAQTNFGQSRPLRFRDRVRIRRAAFRSVRR